MSFLNTTLRRWLDRYFIKQPAIRRFVTRTLERDENRDITLFGTRLRINTIKEHGYLRAFRRANNHRALQDEAGTLVSLSLLICAGDTFVDIGANVGFFVCILARRRFLSKDVRFYAFEANPDTFERLSESARGLEIVLRQEAISDRPGTLEFVSGAVSHVFARSTSRNRYHFKKQTPIKVIAQRLDDVGIEGDSIIFKIDIEGHELAVLNGATHLFSQDRVKAVYLDGYNNDPAVVRFLESRDFTFFDGRTLKPASPTVFSLLAIKLPKCGVSDTWTT
jgi:FkbM family methyltransferase